MLPGGLASASVGCGSCQTEHEVTCLGERGMHTLEGIVLELQLTEGYGSCSTGLLLFVRGLRLYQLLRN